MARPARFTPEQLAQMQAIQQSITPAGLGGNSNYAADDDMWGGGSVPQAPNPYGASMGGTGWQRDPNSASTFGLNPFSPQGRALLMHRAQQAQNPLAMNIEQAVDTSQSPQNFMGMTDPMQSPPIPNAGMQYQQNMQPRQMNPEAAMMAQRFQNAQTGYDGMQASNAMTPASIGQYQPEPDMSDVPSVPVYGADPSVMADAAPQGGQRIFDRLAEVNGGVPQTDWTQGIQRPEQQMQGGRPDMVVAAQNPVVDNAVAQNTTPRGGPFSHLGGLRPDASGAAMTASNPYGELMGGTGWQREPGLRSTFGINDKNGGAIPVGRQALAGARDPNSPWPSASAPASAQASAGTDWTQGIERPDTNWIQGIQPPSGEATNAVEPQGWLNKPLFPDSPQVEGSCSGQATGKGALAAAGVAALGAFLVNRSRKKRKGKQKVSQILAARQ